VDKDNHAGEPRLPTQTGLTSTNT